LKKHDKPFPFATIHKNLTEVLTDHRLASLGDTYTNFIYSLAKSNKIGKPAGTKVKGTILAEALKKAGLRKHLPARMTRHKLADAAEALIVYAWLQNCINLDESVAILEKTNDPADAFTQLLTAIKNRIKFS
jgi:hypothetical protein